MDVINFLENTTMNKLETYIEEVITETNEKMKEHFSDCTPTVTEIILESGSQEVIPRTPEQEQEHKNNPGLSICHYTSYLVTIVGLKIKNRIDPLKIKFHISDAVSQPRDVAVKTIIDSIHNLSPRSRTVLNCHCLEHPTPIG